MPPALSELRFEVLAGEHDRSGFFCGDPALDNYLKQQARQDVKRRIAAVYVFTDGRAIAGYYTLSQFSVALDRIPVEFVRKLPKYEAVPVTLVGRLARSLEFRGRAVGEILLLDALRRSLIGSKQIASWAVIVDAANAGAEAFYKRYGFLPLLDSPQRLFLPMKTLEALFAR